MAARPPGTPCLRRRGIRLPSTDTIGIGGAINGLSGAHRDFLGAGGVGLLIGDGQLNYVPRNYLGAVINLPKQLPKKRPSVRSVGRRRC